MEMQQPTASHARLARFAGDWSATEILYPSPWDPHGGRRHGRSTGRMLDGFFLVTDYEQRKDEEITFRGHGVYGFDPRAGHYTMHWFDSMGVDPGAPVPGLWHGETLTFQHQTPFGHMRYRYEFEGADRYHFSMASSQDDVNWNPLMDGDYRRTA